LFICTETKQNTFLDTCTLISFANDNTIIYAFSAEQNIAALTRAVNYTNLCCLFFVTSTFVPMSNLFCNSDLFLFSCKIITAHLLNHKHVYSYKIKRSRS
jgi:hypothetical protein